MAFLPITKKEMLDRGWTQCDFVYVIGDAYDIDEVTLLPAPVKHFLFIDGQKIHVLPPE